MQEKISNFDAVRQRLMDLLKRETEIDVDRIDPNQDILKQVAIDSMQMLEIYAAIIDEFGIDVPMSIMQAKTLTGIISALAKEVSRISKQGASS